MESSLLFLIWQPKNDTEVLSEKDKKKQEVEEKLQHLNEKKHNMVQMLKQILHAEEEMKKRNSMPAAVVQSPNPLQIETANDAGATPKHAINRMGSEGNSSGDLEGESEDASNHTALARHRQQMSPSASSPLRNHHMAHCNTMRFLTQLVQVWEQAGMVRQQALTWALLLVHLALPHLGIKVILQVFHH
ncbi:hypothetical protein Sjap_015908 [Stephania japonica]|uniref:Uncharacterized protein n=1 Tax=Stephania japonica TaxID=461633 RepID=A0AAP0IK01_9MAGN